MMVNYAQALNNFRALTNPVTGVIRSVDLIHITGADPEVFLATAEPCDTLPLAGITAANRGAACSITMERAVVRACGESIERYCSAFFDVQEMLLASEQQMQVNGRRFISVTDVYPFTAWQYQEPGFPYQPVTRDTTIRWIPGQSVMLGDTVWLPASCVFVPYLFDIAVEPFTHMPISTGLAAGISVESCIHKGIMEILERDALMLNWLLCRSAPRIDAQSCRGISPEIDKLLSAARYGGPQWYFNLLTLDVEVPIISAALIDPGDLPFTSFGIAADVDPHHALLLALEEALLTRVLLNRSRDTLNSGERDAHKIETLRDHMMAHATSPKLRDALRFLTDNGPMMSLDEIGACLDKSPTNAVDRLSALGFEAVFVDVTTPDIASFGFRVVRTVISGMQPLDNDHRYRHLGGKRLKTMPNRLDIVDWTPEMLNPDPHPFP